MVRQLTYQGVLPDDSTGESDGLLVENLGFLLDNLAAAVFVDDSRLLTAFLDFAAGMLVARGMPAECLDLALQALTGPLHDLPRTVGHVMAGRECFAS